ncbi:unnamed protein product [Calicophoron daubneyi]|uniref:Uncharacterized protein n=1 Tax=Calicophoron daubneyi TaxID=300641 RepID=A0AAV2T1Z0_CALDB
MRSMLLENRFPEENIIVLSAYRIPEVVLVTGGGFTVTTATTNPSVQIRAYEFHQKLLGSLKYKNMLIVVDHPNSGRFLKGMILPDKIYALASIHHGWVSSLEEMYSSPFTPYLVAYFRAVLSHPLSSVRASFQRDYKITPGEYGDQVIIVDEENQEKFSF